MKSTYNFTSESGRTAAIANFLASKSATKRYLVEYRRDCDDFDPGCLFDLSEEQLALVKELVALSVEEDEHLWAYFLEEEFRQKYAFLAFPGDDEFAEFYPTRIDLDNPQPVYKFRLAYFHNGLEEKPRMIDCTVDLTDEEYASLLEWRLHFRHYDFHSLSYALPELFKKLTQAFDSVFYDHDCLPPFGGPAYLVVMSEVEEDVNQILALNE